MGTDVSEAWDSQGLALAVDLAGASACPTVAAPGALCPGVALEARWAVAGVTAEKLGLCSASAGTCLAGVFRATLQRRTVAAPQGVEMASLGSWWPEELAASGWVLRFGPRVGFPRAHHRKRRGSWDFSLRGRAGESPWSGLKSGATTILGTSALEKFYKGPAGGSENRGRSPKGELRKHRPGSVPQGSNLDEHR